MKERPYIPSELLEPHLVHWISWLIEEISTFEKFPPAEQWRCWSEQLHGLDRFMTVLDCGTYDDPQRPIHANMAFNNMRCDIDAFYPSYCQRSGWFLTMSPTAEFLPFNDEVEKKARGIWESAREARKEVEAA